MIGSYEDPSMVLGHLPSIGLDLSPLDLCTKNRPPRNPEDHIHPFCPLSNQLHIVTPSA